MKNFEEFNDILDKYMPKYGEGDTFASQIATAVAKIVYRWFNDGDSIEDEGLIQFVNWLKDNVPEAKRYLSNNESSVNYEEFLYGLCSILLDEEFLEQYTKTSKKDSLYNSMKYGKYYNDQDDSDDEDDEFYESKKSPKSKKMIKESYGEFFVKIDGPASALEDNTWQCEEFWNLLHEQGLEEEMDKYFDRKYPDGIGLDEFNGLLRFDWKKIFRAIGGTIPGEEYEENDEEFDEEFDESKCSPKKKILKENSSIEFELFQWVDTWIEEVNADGREGYKDADIVEMAHGISTPDYDEIIRGTIDFYADIMRPETLELLKSALTESDISDSVAAKMIRDSINIRASFMESKKKKCDTSKKLIKEKVSTNQEIYTFANTWIDSANADDMQGYYQEDIIAIAKYLKNPKKAKKEMLPNYVEIVRGILDVFKDTISPEAKERLENYLKQGNDKQIENAIDQAFANVASSLSYDS